MLIPQSSTRADGLSARMRQLVAGAGSVMASGAALIGNNGRCATPGGSVSGGQPCPGARIMVSDGPPMVFARTDLPDPQAPPDWLFRIRYSPFLAQLVVVRKCNLACGYCSEFDKVSEPVPFDVLSKRIDKLRQLGTFGISLTGGEPTLHPELPRLIRKCRDLGFARTGMISNGILMQPKLIEALNEAGLQDLQISIDGVKGNSTTQKVLDNLKKRLEWLRQYAKFEVTVSGVIGACPSEEAAEVVSYAREMGFTPRVLLVHDHQGRLKLTSDEVKSYRRIVATIPKTWKEFSDYRNRLVEEGVAPFKCRAGSRYLYIDEFGDVHWCSQTRGVWSKSLLSYTQNDLREQFYSYKACHVTCTIGCARAASQLDNWRDQAIPANAPAEAAV